MSTEEVCVVCSGVLDAENRARCIYCGGAFHQPWSASVSVPSCGRIFAHAEAQGLVFACQWCAQALLGQGGAPLR
ncbi:MAG: hypothetical protein NZ951_06375 [Dehalococcoidia bacterium]|nr:hypothetical protein [Dehalococcoidia bacterium]MDW8120030.1 hypothetical protein [Chloroflexota bacterium]